MTTVVNPEFAFSREDFERVRKLIHSRAGISLGDAKQNLVYSRLSRRIRKLGMRGFNEYLNYLESHHGDEWTEFTNALTTNLTSFFREAHHFDILRDHLLSQRPGKIRLWSAACSTGEEPYSMAITACEAFGTDRPPVEILATDVDTQVLYKGMQGVYQVDRIAGLSGARQKRFFQKGTGPRQGLCRVKEDLRRMVTFMPLNLLAPRWEVEGRFSAIFCRNVMIYFDKDTQYQVIKKLVRHLHPDGLLFAGHSESFFHASDLVRSCGKTVYRPVENLKEAS